MKRVEQLLLGLFLGGVPPIVGLLAGWWGAVGRLPERGIALTAVGGLLVGAILDIRYLKRWIGQAHVMPLWIWGILYLFYSVCVFGFFMGVPVFNVALGLPAGFIMGARLTSRNASAAQVVAAASMTSWFTTGATAIACVASAALALGDPYTASNLQGMFGLRFAVTQEMILGVILIGGAALLVAQWWLTYIAVKLTYVRFKAKS